MLQYSVLKFFILRVNQRDEIHILSTSFQVDIFLTKYKIMIVSEAVTIFIIYANIDGFLASTVHRGQVCSYSVAYQQSAPTILYDIILYHDNIDKHLKGLSFKQFLGQSERNNYYHPNSYNTSIPIYKYFVFSYCIHYDVELYFTPKQVKIYMFDVFAYIGNPKNI